MKQLLSFLTIGVNDLEKMKVFYRDVFGWSLSKDSDGIVFFKLNGFILSLFPVNELAEDIGIKQDGVGFKKYTLAICYSSEEDVNRVFSELRRKDVKIIKEPQKVFWGGYSGYIADIEDNYWEIAYNPFLEIDKEGNILSLK